MGPSDGLVPVTPACDRIGTVESPTPSAATTPGTPATPAATALDVRWSSWVAENRARGCDPDELRAILTKEGFGPRAIGRAMGDPIPPGAAPDDEPRVAPDVDHLGLSRIRLTQPNIHPDVTRIESDRLQLYQWDDFLSSAECDALTGLIMLRLQPSTVTGDEPEARTSSTCTLSMMNQPLVTEIDERIAKAVGIRSSYAEGIQGQVYQVGQEFKPHTDYFEFGTPEYAAHTSIMGQRTWTFMVYLQATEKGGATKFTNIDRTFYPTRGQALIWNNLDARGGPNPDAIHHGMQVEAGVKVIITKWFREQGTGPMFYPAAGGLEPARSGPDDLICRF
jgi:prolyl 4-hydroxylase